MKKTQDSLWRVGGNLDAKYLNALGMPYASKEEVFSRLPESERANQTVNILGVEYWFTDANTLVIKGNGNSAGSLLNTRQIFGRPFNGTQDVTGVAETTGIKISNGSKVVNLTVDPITGALMIDSSVFSSSEVAAYGVGNEGGSGSGSGLIQTVYNYTNLGQSFDNLILTDTFNAYTINKINDRLATHNHSLSSLTEKSYNSLTDRPVSIPASDVYTWAKNATKPVYFFSELQSKPTTLLGYGITDTPWTDYLPLTGGVLSGLLTTKGLAITNGAQTVNLIVDANGKLSIDKDVYSLGESSAYGAGSTGGGGTGLVSQVFGYSNLGQAFNDSDLTNTFNAFTINSINNRLVTVENKNYLSGLTSTLVINALGFTPYDSTNPAGYITASSLPTKLSQLINDPNFATTFYVNQKVADLVGGAPASLDALNELASALGNDPNFATTVTNLIGTKQNAATAINTGNIANQSVNYAITSNYSNSAGSTPNLSLNMLGNATMNQHFATGVYRNENGLGGNSSYSPVLHLSGIDTGWQIQADYGDTSNVLRFRGEYNGSFSGWKNVWHDGNFTPSNYLLLTGGTLSGALIVNAKTTTKGLTITNGTKSVNLIVDTDGNLSIDKGLFSAGEISAYGAGSGGSGGSLIQTVYALSNLGGSFNNSNLTDTFNAYTINQINSRLVNVESGSATSLTLTGSGNAITGLSKTGNLITATLGSTFSLSTHNHSLNNLSEKSYNSLTEKPNLGIYTTLDQSTPQTIGSSGARLGKLWASNAEFSGNISATQFNGSGAELNSIPYSALPYIPQPAGNYMRTCQGTPPDCNDFVTEGTFFYAPTTGNRPFNNSYGVILNVDGYGGWHNQLGFDTNGSDLGWRQSINTTTSWNDWKRIWHEGNFTPSNFAVHRGEGNNYIEYARQVYNNGAYSGNGWIEPSELGVRYANSAGSAGYANSAGSAGYATYLPTAYIGGQQPNPQAYFNYNIGLKVAMTGIPGTWCDTLWINGYTDSDVQNMCALHFSRNGNPRMWISTQSNRSTTYGTTYEVYTAYNSNLSTVDWNAKNLSMSGTVTANGGIVTSGDLHISKYSPILKIEGGIDNQETIQFIDDSSVYSYIQNDNCQSLFKIASSNPIEFYNGGNAKMQVNYYGLQVFGNITATGEINAYAASDFRLKKNINSITNSLDIINKLNPVSYNWNEKAKELNSTKTDKKDVGLIAQELEKVLPNLVHGIYGDKFLSVDYIKITPFLIGAVKELSVDNNELRGMIKGLMTELNALKG